ncbi:hypothetical protein HDR61_03345 [bacterium]|nr:hypothetical protein [bacterium]
MRKYGAIADASDLAIILGASATHGNWHESLDGLRGVEWWTSSISEGLVYACRGDRCSLTLPYWGNVATRPALPPCETSAIWSSVARHIRSIDDVQIVEFGEYPQTAASEQESEKLDDMLGSGKLQTTGKKYTFNTVYLESIKDSPKFVDYEEYVLDNERYIHVPAVGNSDVLLRNNNKVQNGRLYWVRVEPIQWLTNVFERWWLAKDCLFAGIRFASNYSSKDFEATELASYLKKYFAKQMLPSGKSNIAVNTANPTNTAVSNSNGSSSGAVNPTNTAVSNSNGSSTSAVNPANTAVSNSNGSSSGAVNPANSAVSNSNGSSSGAVNPTNSAVSNSNGSSSGTVNPANSAVSNSNGFPAGASRLVTVIDAPMSVTEQIRFYVEAGESFMMHGPSGVGKSARVRAIDPDLTAIPLWNGVLPEDVVGKVIYPNGNVQPLMNPNETGENATENMAAGGVWVAPQWYNEVLRKSSAAPDFKHVLFIDEVTNARPTTQSLIYHIVLEHSISPSQGRLPDNVVVVLAGNECEDSGAAYNMPAPLFRRMTGHIHLKADLTEWMIWGSQPSMKYPGDPNRTNIHPLVMRFLATNPRCFYTAYDEEEPQKWAIDPRGWEQVSTMIYKNNNVLRRELLENKIGPENAANMIALARRSVISVQDILANNYSQRDIPNNHTERLAMALGLVTVGERNVLIIRNFIRDNLGRECLAAFDNAWIASNPERAVFLRNAIQR